MRSLTVWLLTAAILIGMPGIVLAAPNMIEPFQQKVLDTEWQLAGPVIDGDLSDWTGVPRYPLDNTTADYPAPGARPTPDD